MSDVHVLGVRKRLLDEWRRTKTDMQRIGSVQFRPDDQSVIREGSRTSDDVVSIEVGPVVISVPERGGVGTTSRLFIYLAGAYEFHRGTWATGRQLRTLR